MSGTYTDIVEIVAPSSAVVGKTVLATITIRNKHSASVHVAAAGVLDSEEWFVLWPEYWIPAGSTHTFYGSFTMPNRDVTIHAYSYYEGTDGYWHLDDERTKDVSLSEAFEGVITGKWINKAPEGNRLTIPASVAADGNTFEVGVKYKNLGGAVTAGCEVKVWDPDGLRASPAIDWAGMSTGKELSKEYNICRVDKAGTWTVRIRFLTSDYVEMDRFDGVLLYAEAELVSEFSQFKIVDYKV